jgi:hypothetical protein
LCNDSVNSLIFWQYALINIYKSGKITAIMSRYYRDLHDRELLNQAESVLAELHRRRLLDVRVPDGSATAQCPIRSVVRNDTTLSVILDGSFEPAAGRQQYPDAASRSKT